MVVEYDEEWFRIRLYHDVDDYNNKEPYEVIDIEDLLDVWEKHKKTLKRGRIQ